jgi:hypothetical protein
MMARSISSTAETYRQKLSGAMSIWRLVTRHGGECRRQPAPATDEENVVRYVMLICGDESAWSGEGTETEAVMQDIYAWWGKWHAAGKVIEGGGARLDSTRTAKTVSRAADGEPVVTDGPYLELKEVIGGIIQLEADDLDEAVAIAATWPGIVAFNEKVEVRPTIET